MKILSYLISALAAASGSTGCVNDDVLLNPYDQSTLRFDFGMENTKEIANNRNIPLPNDLYFLDANGVKQSKLVIFGCGSTDVGAEPEVENATKCSLEDLDGWSTTSPFSLPVSGDISQLDTGSFARGIHLISDRQPLIMGQDFTVIATEFGHLQILPLKVLRPRTTYTLVITPDLTDLSGVPVAPSPAYVASKHESGAFGQQINNVEAEAAATLGIAENKITYAAQFTTQSIGQELVNIKPANLSVRFDSARTEVYDVGGFSPLAKPGQFTGESVEKLFATVELPNYLPASEVVAQGCRPDEENRAEAEFWYTFYGANAHHDSFKFTRSSCPNLYKPMDFNNPATTTVEVSMVLPRRPASGPANYDVVIAAHGITSAKQMGNGGVPLVDLFIQPKIASRARTSAADGYAVVAIDHHLHGTRSISFDNSAGFDCNGDNVADKWCFRHSDQAVQLKGDYDLSVSEGLRGVPLVTGFTNADVKNFIKVDALLTSRDAIRKVVADLVNLKAAIGRSVDVNGKVTLNADRISVFGHSMGAMAAVPAASITQMRNEPFAGVILANGGGGIAGITMNSPWFGGNEIPPATRFLPEYRLRMARELGIEEADEQTTLVAVRQFAENQPDLFRAKSDEIAPQYLAEVQYLIQAVVDGVDPLNYAADILEQPVLSFSTVGNLDSHPELKDDRGAGFTAADQVVPFRIELGSGTTFARCGSVPKETSMTAGQTEAECGAEHLPYYSLNVTEFPLAGAEPLDQTLKLADVRDGTARSATWLTEGNHFIGVSAAPDTVSEGTSSPAKINQAASELVRQTVDFLTDDGKQFGVVGQPDEALLPER